MEFSTETNTNCGKLCLKVLIKSEKWLNKYNPVFHKFSTICYIRCGIRFLNVTLGSHLSERSITLTRFNYKTLVNIL